MKQVFLNHDLTKCDCPDEMRITKVRAVVTNSQWHVVMSKYSKCNFLGAKVDGNRLIMNLGDSAVVPVKAHTEYPDDGILSVGDIFAGGFSGWTHVVTALASMGMNIRPEWAIDKDPSACNAYVKTHVPLAHVQTPNEALEAMQEERIGGLHPSVMFQSAIQGSWWLTFASVFMSELIAFSAPCPAWSLADASPGLTRSDGFLLVVTLFHVAVMRP